VTRAGTAVTRGNRQDYPTPRDFVASVENVLGERFGWDAAASAENAVCKAWSGDSLNIDWPTDKLVWLNPPFGDGANFARKCAVEAERGVRIVGLFLAAVGSRWFAEYVDGRARVVFVRPRLTFVGETQPFNRDLMLIMYGVLTPGYETWNWKESAK
jgi:phage N-6-adenine-methyltransferase